MITMAQARAAYRENNNAGRGFSPDGEGLTIDGAVEALLAMGGTAVLLDRATSDDVAVLALSDGSVVAIGGDAFGNSPWAVEIVDPSGRDPLTGNPSDLCP